MEWNKNFFEMSKWASGERHYSEGSEKTRSMMPDYDGY
jgi:hypothetical protein